MSLDINKFYFRLVLLGSNGTGKTSILNRFLFSKFEPKHKPTVEDLFTKTYDLGRIEIKVDILDTSGSMQFPAMRRLSITNGDAFMLVYSVDDEGSFEVLKMCVAEIQEIRRHDYQEIPIVFVGNKSDLPKEGRKVSKELVSNYVYYELPRLRTKVIECSCKENVNVETIFRAYLSLARVSVSTAPTLGRPNVGKARFGSSHTTGGGAGYNNGSGAGGCSSAGGSGRRRPASAVPAETNHHHQEGRAESGSFKVALGVRKSCDASIVTSMRKVSLSSARNSREELESMSETGYHDITSRRRNDETKQVGNSNNEDDGDDNDEHKSKLPPQKSSIESILKAAAIQNQQHHNQSGGHMQRLNVANHDAKPRSRSLIWRPHRKPSRPSSSDQTECRVS